MQLVLAFVVAAHARLECVCPPHCSRTRSPRTSVFLSRPLSIFYLLILYIQQLFAFIVLQQLSGCGRKWPNSAIDRLQAAERPIRAGQVDAESVQRSGGANSSLADRVRDAAER